VTAHRALSGAFAALVVLALAGGAEAKAKTLSISGVPCPVEDELVRALRDVLVDTTIERVDGPADLVVEATAEEVSVTSDGATKRFSGTCAERARLVSAYLALALEPPSVPEPAPKAPEPPARYLPAPPPRAAFPPAPVEVRVGIALGALGTVGTAEHGAGAAPHLALRASVGRGAVHGVLGVATLLPVSLTTRGPDVSLSRLSLDAALRLVAPVGPVALGAELGPVLARTSVEAESLADPEPASSRAELGLRVGALADLPLGPLASVTATLESQIMPGTAALALRREGIVGELPGFYLGGSLGLTLRAK